MALRGAIASLTQGGPYAVTRRADGSYEDGNYVLGAAVTFDHTTDSFTTDPPLAPVAGDTWRIETSGTLPIGLDADTSYFVVEDYGSFQLRTDEDDPDTTVPFSSNGTGDARIAKYTALTVAGSLQPVTGRELQDLPEAQRGDDVRVLYTLTRLYTREPGFEPDVLTIDGESYTVIKVERFDAFGDTHYRVYLARTVRP